MGKIVRSALQVAAVAVNFIPGIGQVTSLAITAGLALGASALAPNAKRAKASPEAMNRLRANIDPLTPRKTCIGITAMAIDIR